MNRATTVRPLSPAAAGPPLRRWAWRVALLAWFGLTAYLAYAKWGTWPRLQVYVLAAQRRCLTFEEPEGRVVFEADPGRAGELLRQPGYRAVPRSVWAGDGTPPAAVSTTAAVRRSEFRAATACMQHWKELRGPNAPPVQWQAISTAVIEESFDPAARDAEVLFVHGLRRGGAADRLVVLQAYWIAGRSLSLSAEITAPASILGEVRDIHRITGEAGPILKLSVPASNRLRLYVARPDPNDSSRFTLDYEQEGSRGTIEGRLRPDDTVDLKVLSGPAIQSPR